MKKSKLRFLKKRKFTPINFKELVTIGGKEYYQLVASRVLIGRYKMIFTRDFKRGSK